MIQTGFWLGNRDWWVMANLGINGTRDLQDVYDTLISVGCPDYKVREVCMTLSRPDTGYTYTDYGGHFTLIFVSKATSAEEMYDSIDHEKHHAVEHICEYYDVNPRSEEAAYLAGELGRLLFPAASYVVCPLCHGI